MTFTTTILLFLLNLSVIGYVAHRSRVAIRGLWARGENLQDQIQSAKMTWNASNNQIYSDLASHIHGKPIRFRSQHGEDVYLWNYFDRKCNGLCVEVGAFDGKSCSNTFAFETLGWKCTLVEPDPEMANRCRENRPQSRVVQAAAGDRHATGTITFNQVRTDADWAGMMSFTEADPTHLAKCRRLGAEIEEITVPHMCLNDILRDVEEPIDFITIDVEGHEMEVLDGFDLDRFQPRVIVTECTYDRKEDRVGKYLESRGYNRGVTIGCNTFFSRESA